MRGVSAVTFTQSVKTVLAKYATFDGRAPRSEYWWFALFVFLASIPLSLIDQMVVAPALGFESFKEDTPQLLSMVFSLALLLPGITVAVRRMHDLDKSGWWVLIVFIPLLGILLMLYWFVQAGTNGSNRFGPDPIESHQQVPNLN